MDIYKNTIGKVSHAIVSDGAVGPAQSAVTFSIAGADGTVLQAGTADYTNNGTYDLYEATVAPAVSAVSGTYTVTWTYTMDGFEFNPTEQLRVVSPYVTLPEMLDMPELAGLDSKTLFAMERLVAGIVDVYTNQTFNRENGLSVTVLGQSSEQLALPRRIISLARVSVLDYPGDTDPYPITEYVTFDPDNPWMLRRRVDIDSPRSLNPTVTYKFFRYPQLYQVNGDWGWEFVPEPVRQAARILVKEYFCEDAKYRDKFIDNIRAGDWRMEFKVTGDETTGSANADMLLTGYRNVGLAVI